MQLDPTAWAIASVGCVYDWLMTRRWKQIFIGSIPMAILMIVIALVVRGHTLDKNKLAQYYLELGEKEIKSWDDRWAPGGEGVLSTPATADKNSATAGKNSATESKDQDQPKSTNDGQTDNSEVNDQPTESNTEEKSISPYAMALFRRVQQLQANNPRSRFVVAMVHAQRGSYMQAKSILRTIAPDDRDGYSPAHAWLSQFHIQQGIQTSEQVSLVRHHLLAAFKGDRVPTHVLAAGGQFFNVLKEFETALACWQRAVSSMPQYWLQMSETAKLCGKDRLADEALQNAVAYFQNKVTQNPRDNHNRILLAESLVRQKKLDEGERVLIEGRRIKDDFQLRRLHSQVYVARYRMTLGVVDGGINANLAALNQALDIDPTNPIIFEEVAHLATLGGAQSSDKLMVELRSFLAEGRATATTHLWIAELHLVAIQKAEASGRTIADPKVASDYKTAIFHLEQFVNRQPDAADCLNNLAHVLVKAAPSRLNDALKFAKQATSLSQPPRAEFFDTLGMVYLAMNDAKLAIAAYERAIELKPTEGEFHRGAAAAYDKAVDKNMAEIHRQKAKALDAKAAAIKLQDATTKPQAPTSQPANATPSTVESPAESQPPAPRQQPATETKATIKQPSAGSATKAPPNVSKPNPIKSPLPPQSSKSKSPK